MDMVAQTIGVEQTDVERKRRRLSIWAAAIGNMMEWYDFAVYAYFASVLSEVFFVDKSSALLLTFATFGIGFVIRPLGGFVIGLYGDKAGRKSALTFSVILMGLSTFCMGLLPSHASIGVAAPIGLVILRLIQGFSIGGEYAGSTSFIVEYADPKRRGLIGSIQSVSVWFALLLGSGLGVLITKTMSPEDLVSYGWRIPFLLGIIVAGVGLYLRLRVEDSPAFQKLQKENKVAKAPLTELKNEHKGALLQLFGLTTLFTVGFYLTLAYLPTYLKTELNVPLGDALLIMAAATVWLIIITPICGWLSDKVGRKPVLIAAAVFFIVGSYSLFEALSMGPGWMIAAVFLLMIPEGLLEGAAPAAFVELFPARVRYSGFSISYNIATAIFGGFAPFIATLLIKETGNKLSPTYYLIAAAVVTLVAVITMRETARDASV